MSRQAGTDWHGARCDTTARTHAGNIGPWLIWAYWVNPLTFALKALTVSEFSAPRWQKPTPGNPSVPLGTAILQANDLDTRQWWIGAAIGILIGYIIVGNIVLNIALRVLNGALNCFDKVLIHQSMSWLWYASISEYML